MADKPFYLTTTLPYVNADPHIGFALEIVHADSVARYQRLRGREVFFTTGTDEHGQKIFQRATEEGREVREYVDYYALQFEKLKTALDLSYDAFIRTTNPKHIEAAQELWRLCNEAGDIYKKKYKGLYCVGDEMFLKETDLVNGKCPNHPNMDPIEIEEENYFFRLSKYQAQIKEYLLSGEPILPDWRRDEALKFVEGGLEDFSISREKARMSWGIPIVGDDSQVMYVWFDALTNYISTLGWPSSAKASEGTPDLFDKFWVNGETVQMAGKDQVRFQSVMWQGMLMSAKLPTTKKVVYHGFITSGGQKMSKSLGNVIEPLGIVEEYGTDALRYYLLRHISSFEDGDFTMEKFKEVYNANLANGLGNLVARVMQMAEVNTEVTENLDEIVGIRVSDDVHAPMSSYNISQAMDSIWERIKRTDELIAETQPFKLIKDDRSQAVVIIEGLKMELYSIAKDLAPFMPETSQKIKDAIKANKKPATLFPRKE